MSRSTKGNFDLSGWNLALHTLDAWMKHDLSCAVRYTFWLMRTAKWGEDTAISADKRLVLDNIGLNEASEQIFFHLLNLEKSGTTQHVFVRKPIRTIRINPLEFAPFFIRI